MGGLSERKKLTQLCRQQEVDSSMVEGIQRAVMRSPAGIFDTEGNIISGVSPSGEYLHRLG